MSSPTTRLVCAWSLGALLVSGSASGHAAAPASSSPAASLTSPSGQPPRIAPKRAPANVLAAPVAPATTATPAAEAAATPAAASEAPAMSAGEARGALERGMTELGELSMRARQSGDMVRIACVQDKQDRAEAVMEVATSDLLTVQDLQADAATRAFATEKLGEAAQQLGGLVAQARACTGKDEAVNSGGTNDARTPQGVTPTDPTSPLPPAQRGLPPIDPRMPPASPVL